MKAVNLLPREAVRQRKGLLQQDTPVLVGVGVGVFITGALALGYMHESNSITSAQSTLEQAKVQLAKTPKPAELAPPTPANTQLQSEQSARLAAVTTALGGRLAWDRILREFSLVLPIDVWLSSLSLTTPTSVAGAAGTPGGTGLTIAGSTYSHNSVARLLARLALIPELSNVSLQSDTSGGSSTGTGSGGLITFTITAGVQLPAGAAALAPPPPPAPPPSTDTTVTSSG